MSTLYSVGCSHTRYVWPTYADILGQGYDKFYNWGMTGVGNFAIMNRVMQIASKMHPNDELIIQWTYPARFDYHRTETGWYRGGNLAHNHDMVQDTINKYAYDELTYQMLTDNYIQLTKAYLAQHNINYKMLGADFDVGGKPALSIAQDFNIPFRKFLNVMPGASAIKKETDPHYTTSHHLEYLRQSNFTITKKMLYYVEQVEELIDTLHDWKMIQYKLEQARFTQRVTYG